MLIYGQSGVGKTVFASTWPKPVFLDADKGLLSVRRPVLRWEVNTWRDLQYGVAWLLKNRDQYETIIVDTVNEVQVCALEHAVQAYPSIRRPYDTVASQSDYGKALSDTQKFLRFLVAQPKNIVLISHYEKLYEDRARPLFIGKKTEEAYCGMMEVVGWLTIVERENGTAMRRLFFDSTEAVTKDRTDTLPRYIDDPNYNKLLECWNTRKGQNG